MAAPYPPPPSAGTPVVVVAPAGGGCPVCGGFVSMSYDMTCVVVLIIHLLLAGLVRIVLHREKTHLRSLRLERRTVIGVQELTSHNEHLVFDKNLENIAAR
ncbi:hypothetical protein PRIPAC_89181 [Pristionchus pacificus]|uniref:Uncharacterized protein n=1 Tax=Pristionchus pacificus TaxID=54126 RepID=A0A2A6CT15_PRIPA|nr:hypothetical protein PRIPAC_89181 [Pristionchus pacificus]|eukprot:PDM81364.1 hypothetical protein PRIPAC_35240 [Pristionchus pacificus]